METMSVICFMTIIGILSAASTSTNIALRKKVYMAETRERYTADKAVDGNADTTFSDHCALGLISSSWLVVDLDGMYRIGNVHITSTNYLAYVLDYIIIGLTNDYEPNKSPAHDSYIVCAQLGTQFPAMKKLIISCPKNTPAMRFLILVQPSNKRIGYLTLSEVEVYENFDIDVGPFVGCFETFEDKIEHFASEQRTRCQVTCRSSNKTYFSDQKNSCVCGSKPIYYGSCDGEPLEVFAVCPFGLYGSSCSKICKCKITEPCDVEQGKCPSETVNLDERGHGHEAIEENITMNSYVGCINHRELLSSEVAHQLPIQDCLTTCRWRMFDLAGWYEKICWCFKNSKIVQESCGVDFIDIYAVCPIGRYGYNCSLICHCKQGKPCSYSDGRCYDGCEDGWTGSTCDERDCFFNNGLCDNNSECLQQHNKSFCFCNKGFIRPGIASECQAITFSSSSPNFGIIFGILIAILLMISILALLFFLINRTSFGKYFKIRKHKTTYYSRQIYNEQLTSGTSQTSLESQTQGKLKLINFPDYVAANSQSFVEEFKSIPMHTSSPCTYGLQKHLKSKNRFRNIIPYDNNRVILKQLLDNESSDYINASFITCCSKTIMIASQGPTSQSLHDFWRMVGEQDVGIIVMLCNLEENNKKKCAKYWPNVGKASYGGYLIQLTTVRRWRGFIERTFVLETPKSIRSQITQLHYTSWPDHGVPDDILNFLTFRKRFKILLDRKRCTSVVHCSAGVGRTGCFMAVEYLLEKASQDEYLDIPGYVARLRSERPHMIQSLSQYEFIYNTMVVKATMGDTLFKKDEYLGHYRTNQNNPKYSEQLMNQFEMVLQSHSISERDRTIDKKSPIHFMSTSGQIRFAITSTYEPSEVMKMLYFTCNTFIAFDPSQILLSTFTSTTIEMDVERSLKLKEIIETNYGTKITIERIIPQNDEKLKQSCRANLAQPEKSELEIHLFDECLHDSYIQFNRMLQLYENVVKWNITVDNEFGIFNMSESDSGGMFTMFACICEAVDSRGEVSIYDQLVELNEQTRTLAIRTLSSFQDLHNFAFNYLLLTEK